MKLTGLQVYAPSEISAIIDRQVAGETVYWFKCENAGLGTIQYLKVARQRAKLKNLSDRRFVGPVYFENNFELMMSLLVLNSNVAGGGAIFSRLDN